MDPARLKADAGAALAAGQFSRAASLYAAYCASAPRDRQSHLRLGDAWARAGDKARAIDAYLTAARGFAEDGFLARAIAASKRVLELDPNHTRMQRILADLYAKRAAGGQALRALLGKPERGKDEPLPVRPFQPLAAEAPAVTEAVTPKPAPTPPVGAPAAPEPHEPAELVVTEYLLEPDPQERTLEEVLRTEVDRRIHTPIPLGRRTPERMREGGTVPGAAEAPKAAPGGDLALSPSGESLESVLTGPIASAAESSIDTAPSI